MRRGIALVLPLARVVLVAGVLGLGFWLMARYPLSPPRSCPAPSWQAVRFEGRLLWDPTPEPRCGINPDGSAWSLAGLKPGSELRKADLRGVRWQGLNLSGITFTDCDFRGACLGWSDLRAAKLVRADLRQAWLASSDLRLADLRGARLQNARLSPCFTNEYDTDAAFRGRTLLAGADLTGARMQEADLAAAELRGAKLCGADLREARLIWADLRGADLRGANLHAAELVDLDRGYPADLRRADVRGVDLRAAHAWWGGPPGVSVEGALYDRQTRWPDGFDPPAHGAKMVE